MFDLYIYYRVRDAQAPELALRVRAMQQQLALAHGVQCALKRRPNRQGSEDGVQTWMEIYLATAPLFETALAAAVQAAALPALTDGPRHTEVFTDLNPCA